MGCQLNHRFIDWFTYSQGSLLAKDGKCKPFDTSADGFSRGEGCIAIVLKPLERALQDHDRVYATVLGTSLNSSGGAAPPGAPVADAQRAAMMRAFAQANRNFKDVDYVELHATGTAKGDPTEANWVGAECSREDELLIGSVKSNIGHTEIVAFLASLCKVISIFKTGTIPPAVNLRTLNPAIEWEKHKLRVPLCATQLPCRNGKRPLVSIASSGIGGSNGHAVLEGPPPAPTLDGSAVSGPVVLMACGLSSRSATSIGQSLQSSALVDLRALSTALGRRAKQMSWRSYAIVEEGSKGAITFSAPQHCQRTKPLVVFLFSGQGPQHPDMGRELFDRFPVFRDSVLEMDVIFERLTGKSIIRDHGLFSGTSCVADGTWPISLILPSIAVFQMALFDLLIHLGVRPDVVLGHSAGETSVLYASGAAPKAMAVELAILRGRTFSSMEDLGGTMAAVSCMPEEAELLLNQVRREDDRSIIDIACYNSPSAVAISGHAVAIDRFLELALVRGYFCRKIRTRVPIHSSMMDRCRDEYVQALRDLFGRYPGCHVPSVTTYSTLTGARFEGPYDAEYFWKNTRNPVLFTHTIQELARAHSTTTIEISPHPVLSSYISQITQGASAVFPSTHRRKQGRPSMEHRDLLELCGQLTSAGHNSVNFTVLNGRGCYELSTPLPEYPFVRKAFPLYPDTSGCVKQMQPHNGPLNHDYLKVNKDTHPTLAEHVIRGEPIMPAAGFIEMALEYGATTLMNVDMRSILSLSSERPMKVDISRDGFLWAVKTSISSSHASAPTERTHASGYLSFEPPTPQTPLDIPAIRQRCEGYTGSSFYHSLAYFSAYGACFRRVTEVFYGYHEALVSIKGMDDALERDGRYLLHPAILDACLHITSYRPFHGDHGPNNYYLPAHVDAVILHCPPRAHFFPEHIYTHTVLKKWTPSSVFYDIIIADDAGTPLCTLEGLEVAKHQFNPPPEDLIPYDVGLQRSVLPLLSDTRDKVNGHKLDQFNGNAASTKQHEDQCADAVIDHISALREVVEQVSRQSGRSVVRLLALGTEFPRTDHFTHLLDGFPLLLFDISAQPGLRASQDVSPRRGTVRTSNIDLANLGSNHPAYFDIISTFLPEGDPYVAQLSRILVPGGLLVLTTRSDLPVVNGHKAHGIERLSQALHDAGLTIRRTLIAPGGSSPTFTAWCQRTESSADGVPAPPVFDPDEAFVFHYAQGHEMDLQWDFSGLDPVDALDVWVLVAEGRDGGAALGLVRALRLEYLSWTIHVVVFPPDSSYGDEASREEYLQTIPAHIREELDIFVTQEGGVLVPRMMPLPERTAPGGQIADQMDPGVECEGSILLEVQGVSGSAIVKGVLGLEMNRSNSWTSTNPNNGPVVAIAQGPVGKYVTVRREATSRLSPRLNRHSTMIMQCIPSVVAGILAQGTHTFSNDKRCRGLRVLVTHSDTATGMTVIWMYRRQGITVVGLPADATPLHLSSALRSGFNLVVSGYTDPSYIQLLRSASCPKGGKMYFWDDPHEGLAWALRNDLWSVQDALELALTFLEERMDDLEESLRSCPAEHHSVLRVPDIAIATVEPRTATFSPHKTYLVLGGIGNLGAHVAWMLYRHGARRLVVTSRRGAASLQTTSNRLVRRTFEYLRSLPDLDLRLSATNASDIESMAELLRGIPEEAPLAGCIVLTAALSDRTFARLEEADFASVYESKIGVVDTLRECVDVGALEFLVPFSSVAGLFGNGGQTNYCAANTAMEEQVSAYPNAFAFVCPGIIDSTMMRSSELGESGKVAQLEQFAQWGITAEDMILWLEDALARFQAGERFARYVPTVDWYALERTRGMPLLGRHLLSTSADAGMGSSAVGPGVNGVGAADEGGDVGIRMAAIVRGVLGVAAEDFSPETPFTAYGVDSLSAARLAFMLRPLVEVTQLQLLADMSLEGLEVLAGKGKKEEGV